MAPLTKEALEKARKTTNDFITNLTFEQAKAICEPIENVIENVKEYVCIMGLGNIYYNPAINNVFCHEMVTKAIYLTYLGGLTKKVQESNNKKTKWLQFIDLSYDTHNEILTQLCVMYECSGNYKDIYEDLQLQSSLAIILGVRTYEQIEEFLTEVDPYQRYKLKVELNPEN